MPAQTLPTLEERIEALLKNVAQEIRPCRACGEMLAIVKHANGKLAPYTKAGINHFLDCPHAARFKRGNG
jgi:hypothetical protein